MIGLGSLSDEASASEQRIQLALSRLLRAIDQLPHYHGAEVVLEPRRSRSLELEEAKEEARRILREIRKRGRR